MILPPTAAPRRVFGRAAYALGQLLRFAWLEVQCCLFAVAVFVGLAVSRVVPLYAGFMYAAVGSYICQAFRRFDLRVDRFPWAPAVVLAVAAYANFFTHHYLPDLRWAVAIGFVVVLWRSRVSYTVGGRRHAMPLSLSFVLIGFFLWVAENAATLLGAWQYPNQAQLWQLVHVGKWGSWALLVSLSFVLVAAVKAQEGRVYGQVGADPAVTVAERAA